MSSVDQTPLAGVVVYRRRADGDLDALWRDAASHGTGVAAGSTQDFAGRYRVRYFDPVGAELAVFDLEVISDERGYRLSWLRDGVVRFVGIGMRTSDDTLVASYQSAPQ